jgi:hypothetical protein
MTIGVTNDIRSHLEDEVRAKTAIVDAIAEKILDLGLQKAEDEILGAEITGAEVEAGIEIDVTDLNMTA